MIFDQGHHPASAMRFRNGPARPFPFEIADHSYRTGPEQSPDGRPSVTSWTYIALTVDRMLPRIVLDAKDNNHWFASSLPTSLAKSQRVTLEGDTARDFDLYAPAGYERQAQQLFPVEVLGDLRRTAPDFDVETVDDQIIFFTRTQVDSVARRPASNSPGSSSAWAPPWSARPTGSPPTDPAGTPPWT